MHERCFILMKRNVIYNAEDRFSGEDIFSCVRAFLQSK